MLRTIVTIAGLATLFSCYEGNRSHTRPFPSTRSLITTSELQRVATGDLLEAVRLLRPLWLSGRAGRGVGGLGPRLWVDNVPYGGVDRLRDVPFDQVVAIRFLSGIDATTRWGTGVPNGVIEVITATGRR